MIFKIYSLYVVLKIKKGVFTMASFGINVFDFGAKAMVLQTILLPFRVQ